MTISGISSADHAKSSDHPGTKPSNIIWHPGRVIKVEGHVSSPQCYVLELIYNEEGIPFSGINKAGVVKGDPR